MPSCIVCKKTMSKLTILPTGKGLVIHLQKCHKFSTLSTYLCGEKNCNRKFTCTKAFVKHVNKCAKDCEDIHALDMQQNVPDATQNIEGFDLNDESQIDEPSVSCSNDDSVANIESIMKQQADAFVCKYYSKLSLPRNIVQDIINDTKDYISDSYAMNILKEKVMSALESAQIDQGKMAEISGLFANIQNPFSHLETEYFRMQYFENSGYYVPPVKVTLGRRLLPIRTKTGLKWKWREVHIIHCPIAPVLKIFLELKDALPSILKYMDELQNETETISNVIQGNLYKKKRQKFQPTDIVLPLNMYYDDFESNNPLGGHCSKIGGVYVSIACLPPEIASRLENIFISTLFSPQDREVFKSKKILEPLLQELKMLEEVGMDVTSSNGETVHVFFILCLLVGDNLAIHQLCGFVCGFAWSNYPCRFCKITNDRLKFDIDVDMSLLRTRDNYREDVLTADQTRTGVSEECALNSLQSFHITENLEADILHDFDEGISHKILTFVLKKFTTAERRGQKPIVGLSTINRRIQYFNFGTHSALYKTKFCISADELIRGKLKLSGSEMQCLVRSLGVLIGDLIPESDPHWKLYLSLQRALDMVLCKSVSKSEIAKQRLHLKELGKQYLSFENNHLTFKFHKIIWHLCDAVENSGPVAHTSTRRYESKHRALKLGLYSNMSRVNACWSAAVKHQLGLCHRFVAGESVLSQVDMGPGSLLRENDMFPSLKAIFPDTSVFVTNWVDYKGSRFDHQSTVIISTDDVYGWPVFGEIKSVYVSNCKVAFLCRKLVTLGFYEHFYAYEVQRSKDNICVAIENLIDPLPLNTLRSPKGGLFVVLRYQL